MLSVTDLTWTVHFGSRSKSLPSHMMVAEPGPAEQAERHDGMAECMRKMGEQPSELSVEERNLL